MTLNIGSRWINEVDDGKTFKEKIFTSLREHFRPEFLNRIDKIIVFNRLDMDKIKKIVEIDYDLSKKGVAFEKTKGEKKKLTVSK